MTRVFVNGNIVRIWWIVWMCIVSAWRLLIRCLVKQLPNWGIICRIGDWRCRNWCILHCPFSLTLTDWNIPISSILIQLGLIEKCNVHQTAFFYQMLNLVDTSLESSEVNRALKKLIILDSEILFFRRATKLKCKTNWSDKFLRRSKWHCSSHIVVITSNHCFGLSYLLFVNSVY